ncbi:class I SAM-dependent methyltransferase [Allokutzneria multivorans]
MSDMKAVVRQGYDAVSEHYRGQHDDSGPYAEWLDALRERIPVGGSVLDVGCGCGVPVARDLVRGGHRVTGVDISEEQIRRARSFVPEATFVRVDASEAEFPDASFDAVVCLYVLFHLPLSEQGELLGKIARWLKPGGWLLLLTGREALESRVEGWLGSDAPMVWSQADAATYRAHLDTAGLEVVEQVDVRDFLPGSSDVHSLFWAREPSQRP